MIAKNFVEKADKVVCGLMSVGSVGSTISVAIIIVAVAVAKCKWN